MTAPLEQVLRRIRQVTGSTGGELGDGELLDRFIHQKDETAFDRLLQRHGRMVLGVCRTFLHDSHDAEDAFQATFLVLVRSARSVRKQSSLSSWLYGVAYRTALKARTATQRRRREEQSAAMSHPNSFAPPQSHDDQPVLVEELQRLPEKYRTPLLLCYQEGMTTEETARQLGWPQGTVMVRLMRGRDLLRSRLLRRGVTYSAATLPVVLAESVASAAVPTALAQTTLQAALSCAAQPLAVGSASASVAALTEGVLHAMFLVKIKRAAIIALGLALLVGTAGLATYQTLAGGLAEDRAQAPVVLPDDPKAVVLSWDYRRPDLARKTEAPQVQVRADGSVGVCDPYGPGQPVEAKLSPQQLQELLRFAVREQGFFALEGAKVEEEIQAEQRRRGLAPEAARPLTLLRLCADGQDKELRCQDLRRYGDSVPQAKRLAAIEQRLEQLMSWAYAGGDQGVATALQSANEELRRQWPDAPLLRETDLQTAHQLADGGLVVIFERRQVGLDPFTFVYARMERLAQGEVKVIVKADLAAPARAADGKAKELNLDPPPIASDASVKYDYPIVYIRLLRDGPKPKTWAQAGVPLAMNPGADLMLLHPDGREEVLVAGGKGSVTDPMVSFDGEWVYYSLFHDLSGFRGGYAPSPADIYKIHVPTRKIVQLTNGGFSPNTGVAQWSEGYQKAQPGKTSQPYPICNMGACPLPGGKIIFTSNRNGFMSPRPTNNGYNVNLQLYVMDDDGSNVEMIGHLNIGAALHPVVLRDGRVMFSTLENQGQRDSLAWGLWSIHPDGTNWDPIISSFISTAFHFQTQMSDGDIVVGAYYGGVGTQGFCTYVKVPVEKYASGPRFGPAHMQDPRNGPAFPADLGNRQRIRLSRIPFSPLGMLQVTCFADDGDDTAARLSKDGPWVGKVTHPSAAPDNHLLTIWNARPTGDHDVDAGIYLIKSGKPIYEPGQMLLIKHDPKYDAQWPRALVPYKRIHGVSEPRYLKPLANDGKLSPHLPEGTPYGLVGSSSLYKRESAADGQVAKGSVTATYPGNKKPPFDLGGRDPHYQGGDAGLYSNDQIHAIRVVALEPTTNRRDGPKAGRLFRSFAMERMRILGEIPVRKFNGEQQPLDPDGNPDTSFLAKIPADVAWTFQTLDKHGMVLNTAQTWHQLRPGEVRTDCGGCHSHSQPATLFEKTAAARPDYPVFDLTKQTPLLTSKANDQSGKKWDSKDETGLRLENGIKNVEYFRDIRPIVERSCVACHSQKLDKPAGNLVLDDNRLETSSGENVPQAQVPNHYFRLVLDSKAKYGYKVGGTGPDGYGRGSRYVWPMQARRSLLAWKIFGERTDGFSNDDFAIESIPGDPNSLVLNGKPVANVQGFRKRSIVGYTGSVMPPPEAVAGTYVGPDGQKIKVAPLTDEDRRTIVRWIDLGCPIDLDYNPANPQERGYGWMQDDNRPTLTLTYPKAGANAPLTRILVGMHDHDTGLDTDSLQVVADFALEGVAPGQNLASKFKAKTQGVWELTLSQAVTVLPKGKLTVSVKDRQGNVTKIERTFTVVANP